ncbi:integrase catalytic domain-containing protein [Trichonephila clavipes]|nr:integrase catalytic domain-containing protein [Trichonephila clavipes]
MRRRCCLVCFKPGRIAKKCHSSVKCLICGRRLCSDLRKENPSLPKNKENTKWYFSSPSAPWHGGWWERMIRSIKQILQNCLSRACVTYEKMLTLLCEGESVFIIEDLLHTFRMTRMKCDSNNFSSQPGDRGFTAGETNTL